MSISRDDWAKRVRAEGMAQASEFLRRAAEAQSNSKTPSPHAGPDWLKYVPENVRGIVQSSLPGGNLDFFGEGAWNPDPSPGRTARSDDIEARNGGRFLSMGFTNSAGSRPYKLYVPSGYCGQAVPLVVMLHGCKQSPDDLATGTAMNDAAEEQVFLVAYPGQTTDAHAQKCWKWFSVNDQQRGCGEPSLIAGITLQVMKDYAVDRRRVYVAGMSAGGAAASIMADAYPDLYAAIGVHSGLACGAAHDLTSALATMKHGGAGAQMAAIGAHRIIPTIVFHGDRDTIVSPLNGDAVVAQATRGADLRLEVQTGRSAGGRFFTRRIQTDDTGRVVTEQWVVHGAGHAWSGGCAVGSYTDPLGPDATKEMLRFFSEHTRPSCNES